MRVTVPLIVDQSLRRGDVEAALRFASSQRDEHLWRWLVEQRELPEDTLRRLLPAACLGGDVRSLWPCLRGLLAAGRHALVVATCLLLAQDDASRLKGNPELALVAVLTAAKRSRDCLRLCAPLLEAAPELAKSCLAAHPGADVAPRLLQHLPAAEHPKLLLGALLHLFENRAFAASEPLLLLYGSLCTKDRPQRLFDLLRRLDDIDAGAKTPLWDHLAARVRSGDTGHRRLLGSGEPCVSLGDGRAAVSPVDIRSVTAESFSKSAKRYWKIATDLDGFQKRLAAMGKPVEVYKTEDRKSPSKGPTEEL
ncbi:hypothetical protein DIPPA_17561 [Diplonema papillatum]|nr:hypothetical protein DIPPA_17561 [Diplonema papillatum]